MAIVVAMSGYDRDAEEDVLELFAMGQGIAFTDADLYAPGYLTKCTITSQKITFDGNGQVSTGADVGEVLLTNVPKTITDAGPIDALRKIAWAGRKVELYDVPGRVWGDRILLGVGILEQPTANIMVGSSEGSMRWPLRDPRSGLNTPLQEDKFLGDNDEEDGGAEGGPDLKDVPKPIVYGLCANMAGRLVDPERYIVCAADKAVTLLCVRDGAAPILEGVERADFATLLATEPEPGYYDYISGAEGTFFRLCTRPQRPVYYDAEEGSEATNTHAQIWQRIRTERCGTDIGDIDTASVTAVDLLAPKEVGFHWNDTITQKDALDEVLVSLCGFERQNDDGSWSIGQVRAPTGTPVVNLRVIHQNAAMAEDDRKITGMTFVRPGFAPGGAPAFKLTLNCGRIFNPMSPNDFLPIAHPYLKSVFAKPYSQEYAKDDTIWDPVAKTGAFPNAPEFSINTGYQPGVDFRTFPHVATEAARQHALFKAVPEQYSVQFRPKITDRILIGQTVAATHAGFELTDSPLFLVLQSGVSAEGGKVTAGLVIGFKTEAP